MITALQSATLLDEVDLLDGDKTKVTKKMLCNALENIYEEQDHALMDCAKYERSIPLTCMHVTVTAI
eukprot:12893206-Prorocentrum_lima.AAC.1